MRPLGLLFLRQVVKRTALALPRALCGAFFVLSADLRHCGVDDNTRSHKHHQNRRRPPLPTCRLRAGTNQRSKQPAGLGAASGAAAGHGDVVGGCIRGPRTKTSYASWFLGKPAV
jgi:hypothetical protein